MENHESYTIKELGMGDIQVTASSELTKKHLEDICGDLSIGGQLKDLHMEGNALIFTSSIFRDWAYDYFTDFDESTLIRDECANASCSCNQ